MKRPVGIGAGTGDKGSYDDLFKIKPECFMTEVFPEVTIKIEARYNRFLTHYNS